MLTCSSNARAWHAKQQLLRPMLMKQFTMVVNIKLFLQLQTLLPIATSNDYSSVFKCSSSGKESYLFNDQNSGTHIHIDHFYQFVEATQPLNALAFVFDDINFGASDFAYSVFSLVVVAIVSIICLLILSSVGGFIGIWDALTIYMGLRAFTGFVRTGTGSWHGTPDSTGHHKHSLISGSTFIGAYPLCLVDWLNDPPRIHNMYRKKSY